MDKNSLKLNNFAQSAGALATLNALFPASAWAQSKNTSTHLNKQYLLVVLFCFIGFLCSLILYSMCKIISYYKSIEREHLQFVALSEMSDELTYQYDFKRDTLKGSKRFSEHFGRAPLINEFASGASENSCPTLDNLKNLLINPELTVDAPHKVSEVILPDKDGIRRWFKLSQTTLFDNDNAPYATLGRIINIEKDVRERERLLTLAQTDALTQICNRRGFETFSKPILADRRNRCALILVDVDNFKEVNDTIGHQAGDELLVCLAKRLTGFFRENDIVARYGGDEFIILMQNIGDAANIIFKVEMLKDSLNCHVGDTVVTASIGASLSKPDEDMGALFKRTDKALYAAKELGPNHFCIAGEE